MTEALTIDCPELSGLSGNFISERSCIIYRSLNPCPESCSQHPKIDPIVTTMPQAAISSPGAEASTPETNTGHSGEPEKKGRGHHTKRIRWCPDLEKQVYNVTCQRRYYRGGHCKKPCDYKNQLDETVKAKEDKCLDCGDLHKITTEKPEPAQYALGRVNYARLCELLETEHSDILEELLRRAKVELRDIESQIVWELQEVMKP